MMFAVGIEQDELGKTGERRQGFLVENRRRLTKFHGERVPEGERREGALDGTEHRGSCYPSPISAGARH